MCSIAKRGSSTRVLEPLSQRHPGLRIVLEHITTRTGLEFVLGAREGIAATVTPQHLLMNRNALFRGGLRPHHYCLPVLKAEEHRAALSAAVTAGSPRLFLGTDSAPHPRGLKEASCGCAGIFSAHAGIELYAEVFDAAGALARLEDFASGYGADFYRLPRNQGSITLMREAWEVPATLPFADSTLVPLRAGEQVQWRLSDAAMQRASVATAEPEATAPLAPAAARMQRRLRGDLPVAIDVETGGFHAATDALLEIAAVLIDMDR